MDGSSPAVAECKMIVGIVTVRVFSNFNAASMWCVIPPRRAVEPLSVEQSSRWAVVPPAVQSLTRLATKLVSHCSVNRRTTELASRGAVEPSRHRAVMPSSCQAVKPTSYRNSEPSSRQAGEPSSLASRQGNEPLSLQAGEPLSHLAFGQSTDKPLNQ